MQADPHRAGDRHEGIAATWRRSAQSWRRVSAAGWGVAAVLAAAGPAGAFVAVESITVRDDNGNGGLFTVDFENNYLPNVVLRENGAASFEALKAQAVAARSFAYYKLGTGAAFIINSTADQVYSLGGIQDNPGGRWEQAVRETEGEILSFNHTLIAAFYVSGAIPSGPTPRPNSGDSDPHNTERWVTHTFADGLLGSANRGTPLGFQGAAANRGAKSQNGAHFMANQGVHYLDILKYYYGGDIQLEQVIQQPGHTPFGLKPLATFERNNDIFGRALTFAGQSRNLAASTGVSRSESFAHTGQFAQKLTIGYDAAADAASGSIDGFLVRHLSGAQNASRLSSVTTGTVQSAVAHPVGNLILPSQGAVGFWLMVHPEDALASTSLQVAIAIDDFDDPYGPITTEQGRWFDVIIDGGWHKYEWFLDDLAGWTSAFGPGVGDGLIASRFTLDSILFRGLGDVTVYLDDVFYDGAAVPIPEPVIGVLLAVMALGCSGRSERHRCKA